MRSETEPSHSEAEPPLVFPHTPQPPTRMPAAARPSTLHHPPPAAPDKLTLRGFFGVFRYSRRAI